MSSLRWKERDREKERAIAGSDRSMAGETEERRVEKCARRTTSVRFSRPWNGELDEERKGRESQEVEEVGGGER